MEVNKFMNRLLKIPLVLEPQQEGGWTVTSPILPELVTEVDDLKQLDEVIRDAMAGVIELYEDTGKEFLSAIFRRLRSKEIKAWRYS
jgi:antitoxin HicB